MQAKILTVDQYFKYFIFREQGTGCGINQEPESNENFFFAETYLPKDYFKIEQPSIMFSQFVNYQLDSLPDKILVKFELFGIGHINGKDAYVFKPWVIGIDNPMLFDYLENFFLFMPNTLFHYLIGRLIFQEELNPETFRYIRILQDISINTFQRYGLDRIEVARDCEGANLTISRIENPDKSEILNFYRHNWDGISDALEYKYFRPLLNTWFRVTLKSTNKTIGFLRLYNTNSSFNGGTFLEYIIDKGYRNKGFAKEASLCLIDFLRKCSYAISLSAEVDDNNQHSIRVLKKLGFSETKTPGILTSEKFSLSLLDTLENSETDYNQETVKLGIQNKYVAKYNRYF